MSRTMAVHVRYNSWYISLPSSAEQERDITKFLKWYYDENRIFPIEAI